MLSKRSLFSATLFKKSITRFMPLWVGYFAIWFLIMPLPFLTAFQYSSSHYDLLDQIYMRGAIGGVLMACAFSLLAAMMVYGIFCNPKTAGAMTSLPIRREGLFISTYSAALVVIIAINLLIALLTGLVTFGFSYLPIKELAIWFISVSLLDIAFFGMASLAASLTGNVFAIPLMYALINVGPFAIEGLITSVVYGASFGITNSRFPITLDITPVYSLLNDLLNGYNYDGIISIENFKAVFWWAAAGIAMAAVAMLFIKRRHIERASDIAATKIIRPVFRGLAAAAGAAIGFFIYYLFFSPINYGRFLDIKSLVLMIIWMVIGTACGWYCGEMLIKKTLKVFNLKSLTKVSIISLLTAAAVATVYFDPLGFEMQFPSSDEILQTSVYAYGERNYFKEAENIEASLNVCKDIVSNKSTHRQYAESNHTVSFSFVLKNGKIITRDYYINAQSQDAENTLNLLNSPEAVWSRNAPSAEVTPLNITYCSLNLYTYDQTLDHSENTSLNLLDAEAYDFWKNGIIKDIEAGNLGLLYEEPNYGIEWEEDSEPAPLLYRELVVEYDFYFDPAKSGDSQDLYRYGNWYSYLITEDCSYSINWIIDHYPDFLNPPQQQEN